MYTTFPYDHPQQNQLIGGIVGALFTVLGVAPLIIGCFGSDHPGQRVNSVGATARRWPTRLPISRWGYMTKTHRSGSALIQLQGC